MAESVTFNNAVYIIPDPGESNWGQNLTNFFVAIPQGCLQNSGGTFLLTAPLIFSGFGVTFSASDVVTTNPGSGIVCMDSSNGKTYRWCVQNGNWGSVEVT